MGLWLPWFLFLWFWGSSPCFLYICFWGSSPCVFVNKYICIFIRKPLSPALCVLMPTCNHDPEAYIPHREMAGSGHSHRVSGAECGIMVFVCGKCMAIVLTYKTRHLECLGLTSSSVSVCGLFFFSWLIFSGEGYCLPLLVCPSILFLSLTHSSQILIMLSSSHALRFIWSFIYLV